MKTLLKLYNFESVHQYYEMVVESKINGQTTQAREQFNAMPKANRKALVEELSQGNNELFMFFFRLL